MTIRKHAMNLSMVVMINGLFFWSRVFGLPWHAIVGPNSVRELGGFPIQYESQILLDTLNLFLDGISPAGESAIHIQSDSFRALIIIAVWKLISYCTGNIGLAFHIVDWLFWTISSLCTYLLAIWWTNSVFVARSSAILAAASPLAAAFAGGFGLHTASSVSIAISMFLIAWINRNHPQADYAKIIILVISGNMYNYQFLLVPLMLIDTFYGRRMGLWLDRPITSVIQYIVIQLAISEIMVRLNIVKLQPNTVQNMLADRLRNINDKAMLEHLHTILTKIVNISEIWFQNYSSPIIFLSVYGAVAGTKTDRRVFFYSIFINLSQGWIYAVSWVIMSTWPIMFIIASVGLQKVIFDIDRILMQSRNRKVVPLLYVSFLISVVSWWNQDLFGSDEYVKKWFLWWLVYR